MRHNSKLLENLPMEYFYDVLKYVSKPTWIILLVVFDSGLKNSDFS